MLGVLFLLLLWSIRQVKLLVRHPEALEVVVLVGYAYELVLRKEESGKSKAKRVGKEDSREEGRCH